jgi:hypothetical protein
MEPVFVQKVFTNLIGNVFVVIPSVFLVQPTIFVILVQFQSKIIYKTKLNIIKFHKIKKKKEENYQKFIN